MDVDAYLRRIGVTPGSVETPDLETIGRLQRAHVTSIPFENLSIVGDPTGEGDGEGVDLSLPSLYRKIVESERGGYCFELNGLFHWLLSELGYDVDRTAARVTDDGTARPPANHHTNVVELDRRYIVDVGLGIPPMRGPTPLDGTPRTEETGVEWRVAGSDRPDAAYCTQYRSPGESEWSTRYVFSDIPRELRYFEATNDFLQSAPESPFTGDPVATIGTETGYRKLSADSLTETSDGTETERQVRAEDWHATLEREFGLRYDPV